MKLVRHDQIVEIAESPPARGAWIETKPASFGRYVRMSPPARGAWIETGRGTTTTRC